jgi:uncharacterized membrane protein
MKEQKNVEQNRTRNIALASILAALIFVVSAYTKIPIGLGSGYIHFGDAFIFVACFLLDTPYAVAAAAIGSAFADLAAGAPEYIVATFVIKGAMALTARLIMKTGKSYGRNTAAFTAAALVMTAGYFAYELLFYSVLSGASFSVGLTVALSGIVPFGYIQSLAGILAAPPLIKLLSRAKIRL